MRKPFFVSIRFARGGFAGAMVLAAVASSPAAHAQTPPSAADIAVAEVLFRDGKKLLEQGQFNEACPKLDESRRIDPAGGTLLLLGICYEAAGKTASAWVVYGEALAVAEKDGRADRVKRANEGIANVEKRLSYLTLKVKPEIAALEGFSLHQDEIEIRKAALGAAVPVDRGKHIVKASASGYKVARFEVDIGADAERKELEITALEEEDKPPPTEKPPPVETPQANSTVVLKPTAPALTPDTGKQGSARRVAGLLLGGAGVIGLGVGAFFGLQAKSDHDEAIKRCPQSPCGDAEGVQFNENAQRNALVADITVGAGIALVGAGVVLILLNPSPSKVPSKSSGLQFNQIAPTAGKNGGGVWLTGVF